MKCRFIKASRLLILGCVLAGSGLGQPAGQRTNDPSQKQQDASQEQFDLHFMASGFAEDGTMLSINVYEGSDGHKVSVLHGKFPSYQAAKAHLQYQVKHAEHLFSLQPRTDVELGLGERALVLFPETKSIPQRAAILLTEGPHYYEIVSESLDTVLDVEQRAHNKRFKH